MAAKSVLAPASLKQEMFLKSECDFTLFGGAAGSGKSYLGLLSVLKYVDDKFFRGVVFRRTYTEIRQQGGLWDTAVEMYKEAFPLKGQLRIREKELTITFPSGASVKFSHMEHDKNRYDHKGAQYTYILFDECTEFSQEVIEYLGTRLRSVRCKYKPHMKLTANPDPDSFAFAWVQPYLGEDGIPDRSKDGMIRYFVVEDGKYTWADEREELEAIYGTGDGSGIMSFTFISATCEDNPPLMKADPNYVSRLKAKPRVEMERLLLGSWTARESASGYWKREWCPVEHLPPTRIRKRVRAWDISGTLVSDSLPNPDWTVGVLMSVDEFGIYWIEDVIRGRWRFQGVFDQMVQAAKRDGTGTTIIIPVDPGAAGKAYASSLVRDIAELGYYARMKTTHQSKVTRFAPFASTSEAGGVKLISGEWNKEFMEELERFDGSKNVKDDQVDATADAFWAISRSNLLPVFELPQMTQKNPFAFQRL